jgi:hypothetical protein
MFYRRRALLDRLQDAGSTDDSGVDEVLVQSVRALQYTDDNTHFLNVSNIEVERACSVENDFEGWIGDYGLIESVWLSNVWNNGKVQLAFVGIALVLGLDLICFLLCSHCRDDRVSMTQEGVEGMRSNEAAASCKKNSCHGRGLFGKCEMV